MPRAVERRFRPIMLTSLTIFFGLVPMLLETSVQARLLVPMAMSLAFGVMFSTRVTLGMVPALYLVLDDVQGYFPGRRQAEGSAVTEQGRSGCRRLRVWRSGAAAVGLGESGLEARGPGRR